MHQVTFAKAGYRLKHPKTRREKLLSQMDDLLPWHRLEAHIAPPYPSGKEYYRTLQRPFRAAIKSSDYGKAKTMVLYDR
jgi:hypothetical protein